MDEQGWLACDNLYEMVNHVRTNGNAHRTKVGRRRFRLLACACARRVWGSLNEPSRALVEGVEMLVDGQLTREEVESRYQAVQARYQADRMPVAAAHGVVWAVASDRYLDHMATSAAGQTAIALAEIVRTERLQAGDTPEQARAAVQRFHFEESRRLAGLMREIFGNPFRPLPKRKLPADVRGLAQACYEDHGHYPMLADALADLGEDEAAAHCRLPGHVRGCHVVDWVLGKG